MRILVMTEPWQAALACIQSFGRRRHEVAVLAAVGEILSPNARSRFVRGVFRLQPGTLAAFAMELTDLVKRNRIDLVVPISDLDAEIVAAAKAASPDITAFVTGPPEAVAITRSRNRMAVSAAPLASQRHALGRPRATPWPRTSRGSGRHASSRCPAAWPPQASFASNRPNKRADCKRGSLV